MDAARPILDAQRSDIDTVFLDQVTIVSGRIYYKGEALDVEFHANLSPWSRTYCKRENFQGAQPIALIRLYCLNKILKTQQELSMVR